MSTTGSEEMSPPYARFEKLDEAKQRAILDAATREFVRCGYEGASLNQLIAEAGISKGSFYYYFEDKLDLFMTLLEQVTSAAAMVERSGILLSEDGEGFWGGLAQMVELGMEVMRARPELSKLGEAFASLSPQAMQGERVKAFMEETTRQLTVMLAHGQELGVVRDDVPMEVLIELWMGLDRTLDRWGRAHMMREDEEGLRRVWEVSADLFRRMFAASGEHDPVI